MEVSIRTQLSYTQTAHSDIFWFADSVNFTQSSLHQGLVTKLHSELDRSDDDQVVEFRHRYSDPFPPSWITMEVTSFGTLSMLYKGLKNGRSKRALANYYGLSDTVMESWLHAIVYVRNICAHHSRLWNKNLRIRPLVPRHTAHPFLSNPTHNNRTFYVLSIILYLLKTVNPQNTLAERVRLLLDKYPSVDYVAMGFPHNWEQEPLWQ
nr:Abi family protein [Odoribacter sp. OF09-27XD]